MALAYYRNKILASAIRGVVAWQSTAPPKLYDEEIQIPSRDKNRTIKAHVYKSAKKPEAAGEGEGKDKPQPVILNFHGSGFILRVHGEDAEFCHYLAQNSEYTVLDVSYRLAPEDPYPAALNDVEDAVRWVIRQAQSDSKTYHYYDSNRIVLSGFSAGACLSLAASAVSLEPGLVHTVLAFYPPTDLSRDPYSKKAPSTTLKPLIDPAIAGVFDRCYIPAGLDPKTPGISPLFASPDRFPSNILIITCDADTLCVEAEDLAEKLKSTNTTSTASTAAAGGRNLVLRRMKNCGHAWDKKPVGEEQIQRRDEAYKLALDFLPK